MLCREGEGSIFHECVWFQGQKEKHKSITQNKTAAGKDSCGGFIGVREREREPTQVSSLSHVNNGLF